jgi:hypothetical protein
MDRAVGFEISRWIAPRHFFLPLLTALLALLLVQAGGPPSATGIAAVALVVGILVTVSLAVGLVANAATANRPLAAYRRSDGAEVESNDPPVHPVRPRAPGQV